MSKYMTFESEAFADRDLLVESLGELGFGDIIVGNDLLLRGYDKRDERTADVVIRREAIKGKRFYGDVGFRKTKAGYVPVIDDMDLSYHLGRDFLPRLRVEYGEATARRMAKKLRGTVHKKRVGKTIKLRVRFR